MIVPLAVVGLGMITPYTIRWLDGSVPVRLVIGAHMAGLALMWIGVLDLVVASAGLTHSLAEFCEMALTDRRLGGDVGAVVLPMAVAGLMLGRATYASGRTAVATRRIRRVLLGRTARAVPAVTPARTGFLACTVGLARPRTVIDDQLFQQLPPDQRRAVLAHERSHARGYHGLIDLVVRAMAAGVAPLPGARIARREIRPHLEALADDRAAACTTRRTVAATIVASAITPPAPTLGVAGGPVWRVDRLLDPQPLRPPAAGAATVPIVVSLLALAQTISHAIAGVHLMPLAFPAL